MKKQQDVIIDAFEARIMQLITITNITKLPRWTDADVIGAECLLKAYLKIKVAINNADNAMNTALAKIVIDSAAALNLNPMYFLSDFCKIISDGDSVEYKQLFDNVHQAMFEQRDTIPFLIEEPEKTNL